MDITIEGRTFTVAAWRNGPIAPSKGYGGHQVTERPKKTGITDWDGRPPFELQLPIVLSLQGASVTTSLRTLERAATAQANERPDPVTIAGVGLDLPPGSGQEGWFIENVDRSGKENRSPAGILIRKELVLTLLEKNAGDQVRDATPIAVPGSTVIGHYRVKKGDTLPSIAARVLGDAARWPDIAALNGLRSPRPVKVRLLLKLP